MKAFFKETAFILITIILLSLCLTPLVFATEEISGYGYALDYSAAEKKSSATSSDAEKKATASDAAEKKSPATASEALKNMVPETDTVSTGEELFQWLSDHEDTGGAVTLSDDIYLRDFIFVHGLRQPEIVIDTGKFSIITDGCAELHAGSPLTIRGLGGERGVLRAAKGGELYVNGITLEAEEGYAAFQEEGGGLLMDQAAVSGAIHYARMPYVMQWEDAMVVEEQGQIFDESHLPGVLKGRVIRQGQITDFYEEIPVIWDLTGLEEAQKLRQRFTVAGKFANKAAQKVPICTVVYDDFPLTFLEVKAKRIKGGRGDIYKFTGAFSIPEDRLPITIAQEYSFDAENWMFYEKKEIENPADAFTILLSAGAWEQEPQEIFIRLSWDDGGIMYYSNVLRFAGDNLEECGDHGGNRGGGTDIVNPPGVPDPDPDPSEPETAPPGVTEPETILPPGVSGPETVLPPEVSEPNTQPTPGETEPETQPLPEEPDPDTQPTPEEPEPETQPTPEEPEPETQPTPEEPEADTQPLPGETDPDTQPTPEEPDPDTQPTPEEPDPDTQPTPGESDPETVPSPGVSELAAVGQDTILPPESSEPETLPPQEPSKPETSQHVPATAMGTPGVTPPVKQPDARSAVAGLGAIAASIAGAALYLNPKARKRLMKMLRELFSSKS